MKRRAKLKDMLVGTVACIVLTLLQFFGDTLTPSYRGYRNGLKLLILWLVVIICWIVYLVGVFRSRRKDKEEKTWNSDEIEPR